MSVEYIDHMGNDDSVVRAARVSMDKSPELYTAEENARLIAYLARHGHEIPFAHTAITLRVRAPVAVRAQAFRHKVGFVESEVSRRYVSSTPGFFVPEFRAKAENVKQGSGELLDDEKQDKLRETYAAFMQGAQVMYHSFLDMGVAPEQARFLLPQGMMTEWVWTGSLLAFARFYRLRSDAHAQKEIQDLAHEVGAIIADLFPVSWKALTGEQA
uniref:Thymidylate synthase complementing protein n=1 Tax=Podoviridae sp. ctnCN2 TaxID=2825274 RepID=A0A8S5PM25_9CAUD|nr:MAG TPA: Thymidylate synthase complementing protein [Podoviridae sp. ctnCN2]